jgi:hypothetical protein
MVKLLKDFGAPFVMSSNLFEGRNQALGDKR